MESLQTRLDRAAEELTRPAIPPDPAAIRRRSRRRRQRQLLTGALLVVAALAVAPLSTRWLGVLGDESSSTSQASAGGLQPPAVAPGQLAVVIQPPTHGLPSRLDAENVRCWDVGIGPPPGIDPASVSHIEITGTIRVNGQARLIQIIPKRTASKPGLAGALARIQLGSRDDGPRGRYLLVEGTQARFHLQAADGSRGSVVGPHRLTDQRGALLQPAGTAQAAFAWWCPTS